ncbi:MAG TPA: phospholipase D-like domain-containing protein [Ktedonobacteraceae bacterium]|nr:phospholipase D-like domain-containing protein [Ktedonobacteraceae bacterium]
MKYLTPSFRAPLTLLKYLCLIAFCCLLVGCNVKVNLGDGGLGSSGPCQSNCAVGTGANGLNVIVEPDAGPGPIVDAISRAKKSVWLEMYLLTNKSVINALEEDANNGLDVRVMLETHPYGGGSVSPQETLDKLKAAGVKAQASDPDFALTHEKGMIIDNSTAYIMTSNFTNAALGTSSSTKNREYDIVDTNSQDVQALAAIFQADWNHTTASFKDPNLVVSPVNARSDFNGLIASAKQTLLVTGEEMNDDGIEQDLVNAAQRGVRVEVILPAPDSSSSDSNSKGIATIKQGGVQVREDSQLYMHAKIMIIDGKEAFVGSQNISTQSLDQTSRRRNH